MKARRRGDRRGAADMAQTEKRVTMPRRRFSYCEADMKLDMDLLRAVLIYVEENATRVHSDLDDIRVEGWTGEEVAYHVVLAAGDDLIKASIGQLPDEVDPVIVHTSYSVHRLTMRGHDFLGTIREPSNWDAVKAGTRKIGAVTVGAAVEFGKAFVRMKISEVTGVPI
jgi:hypothetical protein